MHSSGPSDDGRGTQVERRRPVAHEASIVVPAMVTPPLIPDCPTYCPMLRFYTWDHGHILHHRHILHHQFDQQVCRMLGDVNGRDEFDHINGLSFNKQGKLVFSDA